jgi:hypothetical protein
VCQNNGCSGLGMKNQISCRGGVQKGNRSQIKVGINGTVRFSENRTVYFDMKMEQAISCKK